MKLRPFSAAIAVAASLVPLTAYAHVTVDVREAPADSYQRIAFRVPHGCDGNPTTAIRLRIPDGVTGVKPQPKTGWTLATQRGQYAKPVDAGHGRTVTEGVVEVTWSSGNLADEHFDEFVLSIKLPNAPDTTLYFPVVQECSKGTHRWIEIPAAGKSADDYKEPAPAMKLTPKRM